MSSAYYEFDCGCKIKVLDHHIKHGVDELPSLWIDYEDIEQNYSHCYRVWELLSKGQNKGLFQLESYLGKEWSYKVKPTSIEHISDISSIIRPGCRDALIDDKSMTEHYALRKSGQEEITYLHPALEPILASTQGVLVYQEQAIQIAKDIAGFSLSEADTLRKSIGKKDTKLMSSLEEKFITGCLQVGLVNKEQAIEIFNWIRESQRYSFNLCLDSESQVITKDGIKLIKDIVVGDYVLAPNLWTLNNEFVKVLNVFNNGNKEVYEINFLSGDTIQCTIDHEFLCSDNIKRKLSDIINKTVSGIGNKSIRLVVMHDDSMRQTKISNITYIGIKPTVDIEVDNENHVFYANNIAVSNSHGISYSIITYWSAWVKAHLPLHFFASWLAFAANKIDTQEEVKELVTDSRKYSINIAPPSMNNIKEFISLCVKDNSIFFGIDNIKGIGINSLKKLLKTIEQAEKILDKELCQFTFLDYLFFILGEVNQVMVNNLICAGALDHLQLPRSYMIFEYNIYSQLTPTQIKKITSIYLNTRTNNLHTLLQTLCKDTSVNKTNFRHIEKLNSLMKLLLNPPYNLIDTYDFVALSEKKLLGTSITCTKLDMCDKTMANTNCRDCLNVGSGNISLCVEIIEVREFTIKNGKLVGKKMARLKIEDDSGGVDAVAFPDSWKNYKDLLYVGNTILISGQLTQDKKSIVIQGANQI